MIYPNARGVPSVVVADGETVINRARWKSIRPRRFYVQQRVAWPDALGLK